MRSELDRLLSPLDADALALSKALPVTGEPVWLDAGDWRVFARVRTIPSSGQEIQGFMLSDGRATSARWDEASAELVLPFDLDEAYTNLVSERWRSGSSARALSSRHLAAYYRVKRLVPRRLQLSARRALARWQGLPAFPRWPFESSVAELLRFYVRCRLVAAGASELEFRWFWPESRRAALILTHDVESAAGLALALELADLEQDRGLRSSFNIVASWYPIDDGIVRELLGRGFELGVHGVYHDRSMFASRENFEAQQGAVREAAARFQAQGFRSPATHRVFEWLGDLPLQYDCSVPHSDPYEPQPGGCCSPWPFFIGGLVELPYTMPQDHTLFTVLGRDSIDLWLRQVDTIAQHNGLIQSVTHPDPGYLGDADKRAYYSAFLDAVVDRDDLWAALPRDAANWWRQRDEAKSGPWNATRGRALLGDGGVSFEPLRESCAAPTD